MRHDHHDHHDHQHHEHKHHGRSRYTRHFARARKFRSEWNRDDNLAVLEEHRRDVEEYLADLSDQIRRLRDKQGVSAQPVVAPEASPEPS